MQIVAYYTSSALEIETAIWQSAVGCIGSLEGIALQRSGRVGTDADILTMRVSNFQQKLERASVGFARFVKAVLDNTRLALVSLGLVVRQPDISHYYPRTWPHHRHYQNSIVCVVQA